MADSPTRIATILDAGYHLNGELGGGMKRVEMARDLALRRQNVVELLLGYEAQ